MYFSKSETRADSSKSDSIYNDISKKRWRESY